MKRCPHCERNLSKTEFRVRTGRNILESWCNSCNNESAKKWYHANKEQVAASRRLRLFGLSETDHQNMVDSQDNLCAICGRAENGKALAVDHDHDTGEIRGLLCAYCNVRLGWFDEYRAETLAYLGA